MLLSMALTSFLTGVTEPIEFSFMFLAPLLYAIHAVLTGIAMALMHALGVHLGFGFSAGLFDYVLNFSQSTRPWLLVPVGLAYFAVYYGLFRFFIVRFDLKTLGREDDDTAVAVAQVADGALSLTWIKALGSASNLRVVEACTTRLRLVVVDASSLDEPALKALGARGVLRLADGAVQVVVGPIADQLASEIRQGLRRVAASDTGTDTRTPATVISTATAATLNPAMLGRVLAALGGRENIVALRLVSSRLCLSLRDPTLVNEAALAAEVRAVARPTAKSVHLILGPAAATWRAGMTDS
jgi:PTS system N-acetylglucosamine-specific IIC component